MADLKNKLNQLNETKDYTESFEKEDIESNKTMAILAYLSWLLLIPLIAAKESKFAKYHCNQGLVLAIAETLAILVCGLLSAIPLIGWIFVVLESIIGFVCFVLAIIGIVNAAGGKAKDLPIVGKVRILKD